MFMGRYDIIKKEFIVYCTTNKDRIRSDIVGSFYITIVRKYKVYPSIHTLFYWYDIYNPNKYDL